MRCIKHHPFLIKLKEEGEKTLVDGHRNEAAGSEQPM